MIDSMKREMEKFQLVERSINKKFRKELWGPFVAAIKRYELIQAGDKIAVIYMPRQKNWGATRSRWDIIAWRDYNGLEFLQCACRFTENRDASEDGIGDSKRQEIKFLIRKLRETNPYLEKNIFNSIHAVCLDTFPEYKTKGEKHSFLEDYDD